jgi:hypothetical protein
MFTNKIRDINEKIEKIEDELEIISCPKELQEGLIEYEKDTG